MRAKTATYPIIVTIKTCVYILLLYVSYFLLICVSKVLFVQINSGTLNPFNKFYLHVQYTYTVILPEAILCLCLYLILPSQYAVIRDGKL